MFEFIVLVVVFGGIAISVIKGVINYDENLREGHPEYNYYKGKQRLAQLDEEFENKLKIASSIVKVIDTYYTESKPFIGKTFYPIFIFWLYKMKIQRKLKKIDLFNIEVSHFEKGDYFIQIPLAIKDVFKQKLGYKIMHGSTVFNDYEEIEYIKEDKKMLQLKLKLRKNLT
jgi:hypothetical protein